jgi:hypothetical protein
MPHLRHKHLGLCYFNLVYLPAFLQLLNYVAQHDLKDEF